MDKWSRRKNPQGHIETTSPSGRFRIISICGLHTLYDTMTGKKAETHPSRTSRFRTVKDLQEEASSILRREQANA